MNAWKQTRAGKKQRPDSTAKWKGLNITSDISVNLDIFNRKSVIQFPKVTLVYDIDLSRYCATRKFYSDLRCLQTYSHSVQNTYILYVGPKFTDCFVIHVGTIHCQSNYVHLGYSVCSIVINNVFLFRISFVVENCITFHSMNIVLGCKIKHTWHMIGITIYNHLLEKWDRSFACFGQSSPPSGERFIYPRRQTSLHIASHFCFVMIKYL